MTDGENKTLTLVWAERLTWKRQGFLSLERSFEYEKYIADDLTPQKKCPVKTPDSVENRGTFRDIQY